MGWIKSMHGMTDVSDGLNVPATRSGAATPWNTAVVQAVSVIRELRESDGMVVCGCDSRIRRGVRV